MIRYTKKNLQELEDQAQKSGFSEVLEARFAREELDCVRTGLSLQRYMPGVRQPFHHSQPEEEEIYVVLSGSGRMRLDDDVVELEPFDAIRVAPETVRGFEAGPGGLEVLAFGEHGTSQPSMQPPKWPE